MITNPVTLALDDGRSFKVVFTGGFDGLNRGLDQVVPIRLTRSFVTLVLEVAGPHTSIILDGQDAKIHRVGDVLQVRVSLERDIEFHRLSIIEGIGRALVLDVAIEHLYSIRGAEGIVFEPKWSLDTYLSELKKYRSHFELSRKHLVTADLDHRSAVLGGSDAVEEILPQAISRIERLLIYTIPTVMAEDFHRTGSGNIDRNAILTAVKSQRDRLQLDPAGSIVMGGKEYTTSLALRDERVERAPDLDEVTALLAWAAHNLKRSGVYVAAFAMLRNLVHEAEFLYPQRRYFDGVPPLLLQREMRSTFGRQLQHELTLLVAIIRRVAQRDALDAGLLFLESIPRDFDVFEMSVYATCAKALGLDKEEMATNEILHGEGVELANGNAASSTEFLERHLASWRRNSVQPSKFRPDVLTVVNGCAVVVDAKFRISTSSETPVSADAIKEVQAYLNDFDLRTAVIIAPRLFTAQHGFVEIKGDANSIFAVELQDSDDPATLATLAEVFQLASSVASAKAS